MTKIKIENYIDEQMIYSEDNELIFEGFYEYFKDCFLSGQKPFFDIGSHKEITIDTFLKNIKNNNSYKNLTNIDKHYIDIFIDKTFNQHILYEKILTKKPLKILQEINENNLRLNTDMFNCVDCGAKLKMKCENNEINFFKLNIIKDSSLALGKKYIFDKASNSDCVDFDIIKVPVFFETGQLLCNDWFRIAEFNEELNQFTNKYSLENNLSISQRTIDIAKQYNIAMVQVGNSSPGVYEINNNLCVGYVNDENFPNYNDFELFNKKNKKTNICTDLWATTIIDKANLINIVQKNQKSTIENAIKTVEEYINKNHLKVINVEPGNYYLYCSFNHHKYINDIINNYNDKEAIDNIELNFILSKNPDYHIEKKITKKLKP